MINYLRCWRVDWEAIQKKRKEFREKKEFMTICRVFYVSGTMLSDFHSLILFSQLPRYYYPLLLEMRKLKPRMVWLLNVVLGGIVSSWEWWRRNGWEAVRGWVRGWGWWERDVQSDLDAWEARQGRVGVCIRTVFIPRSCCTAPCWPEICCGVEVPWFSQILAWDPTPFRPGFLTQHCYVTSNSDTVQYSNAS